LLTAVFGIIVIYTFVVGGFIFFKDAFTFNEERVCDNILTCVITTLNYGIRSGGGIGDVMSTPKIGDSTFFARFLFDASFFFLVIIIILNIIFGIIIDTFADLREQKSSEPYPPFLSVAGD